MAIYGYVSDYKPERKGGNVYFIRDGLGFVKIGLTKDVSIRLKELQTSNPCELEVFCIFHVKKYDDAREIEKELHDKFAEHRTKKTGEWYYEKDVIDWLRNGNLEVAGYKFQNIDW